MSRPAVGAPRDLGERRGNGNGRARTGVGIIGGGLMGRELASAVARWVHLSWDGPTPEIVAVCDTSEGALRWFERLPGPPRLTRDRAELLADPAVEVVYAAVPHDLHEEVYLDVLAAGKDLMAEKPFGIDLAAARRIVDAADRAATFVRCSSEFPFYPGAQRLIDFAASGAPGRILEVTCSFLHGSDLNPEKPINWKRRAASCGEIGVMGDLGLHTLHIPLRLGWAPQRVYAELENVVRERPDGHGGTAACDTYDNASLHCRVNADGYDFPLALHTKRIAPGEMNTWSIEVLGTRGGARFSTKRPKTLWTYRYRPGQAEQPWERQDVGSQSVVPTITGGIFEVGFTDAVLQMWAAYLAERAGRQVAFGCVTPAEALTSQRVFAAALASHASGRAETLP